MSAETFTPAVERAAELLIHEAETTGLITEDVRNGLAAALDVEEMARAIAVTRHGLLHRDDPDYTEPTNWDRRIASDLRTALLGADS